MNLLHLEYFREVAINEHVQKTGEQLHVSPSAISAGIRSLEQELGVNLFDRVGRNMRLNEYGRQFLPYVEEAFASLKNGVEVLRTVQGQRQQCVRFSVKDGTLWNDTLLSFVAEYPDIHICQVNQDPDLQGKLLDQEDLDFAITDSDLDNSNLEYCVLFWDKLVIVVSKDHPQAARSNELVSLFDFRDDLFLCRPKTDVFQQYVDHLLNEIGFVPQKTMSMEYMLRYSMFNNGPGIIISTQQTLRHESSLSEAVCLQIKEFEGFRMAKKLYWRKNHPLSAGAETLKDYLQMSCALL